jgi:hypothetical protein
LPFEQIRLPAQICVQKPQLFLSFWRSTQVLPHRARPDPQLVEHTPFEQTRPIVQRVLQAPQCCGLVPRSKHASAIPGPPTGHAVSSPGQEQAPWVHDPPKGHVVPHAPQLALLVWRSTQVMPIPPPPPAGHAVSPVGQPAVQAPLTHVSAMGQRRPHAPQLAGSVPVSVHWPPQVVSPAPHTHFPLVQLAPVPHAVPQVPQSKGSLVRSTHAPMQLVSPLPQLVVQTPEEHTWPVAQTIPHPPQLAGSLWVSVQTPLQRWPLLKQAHSPAWHVVPAPHRLPHPPQLAGSVCSSAQAVPHAVRPLAHTSVHLPATQVSAPGHVVPHAPQLPGSVVRSTQTPLQGDCPFGQAQWPALQVAPFVHVVPHPPQFEVSVCSFTHDVPHWVRPAPQMPAHTPSEQTWPAAHA